MSTAAPISSLGTNPQVRGAGRLDLSAAAEPGLTFDKPSLSFGLTFPGSAYKQRVTAADVAGTGGSISVSTTANAGPAPTLTVPLVDVPPGGSVAFDISVTPAGPGDFYGSVDIAYPPGGRTLHIPYWGRAVTNPGSAGVLLVDDDGSGGGVCVDRSQYYTDALTNLGRSFAVWDVQGQGGVIPSRRHACLQHRDLLLGRRWLRQPVTHL